MKIICGLALMSLISWGQAQKLIQLKYVDANKVNGLLRSYATGVSIQSDDTLHTLALRGNPETVAAVEEAVKKLDVPPIDFELTVYLVSSSPQIGDQLPEALAPTAKQLHGVFAYKGYQLLESFMLRGRDGQGASSEGTIKNSTYTFRYSRAMVMDGAPKMVNLQNLNLQIRMPSGARNDKGQAEYKTTGLSSDIDIREGQKVVVGKSDVNNGESPLILVVTVKVVE